MFWSLPPEREEGKEGKENKKETKFWRPVEQLEVCIRLLRQKIGKVKKS